MEKNYRKCRDELVKKAWGQGKDGLCSGTTMSNIHKSHPHNIIPTCGAFVLYFTESVWVHSRNFLCNHYCPLLLSFQPLSLSLPYPVGTQYSTYAGVCGVSDYCTSMVSDCAQCVGGCGQCVVNCCRFLVSYIPGGTTGLTFMVKLFTQLCSRTVSQAVDA